MSGSGAFTLERRTTGEPATCSKCAAQVRRGEKRHAADATYDLKQLASTWPLCTNHAAAAAHAHQIKSWFTTNAPKE